MSAPKDPGTPPMRTLAEVNSTIDGAPRTSRLRSLLAFTGPGLLVAVGYMDPGNWVTSIQSGALFGNLLFSVVLLSSLIAMLLQYMAAKLGVVTGMDLAQAMRTKTGKKTAFFLWMITELAIMATDIAEVIGSAIALNLLFGLNLTIGVLITVLDVFGLLLLMRLGFRKIEAIVAVLIFTIMGVMGWEVLISHPDYAYLAEGFLPHPDILHTSQLTMALGIIGATVMPHNLFLHSAIVQTRSVDRSSVASKKFAVKWATWDSNIQLAAAFLVNCLLLVMGAVMFAGQEPGSFSSLNAVYNSLKDSTVVGSVASSTVATLFAVALLASGQNSTITGTITGQVVMEGFMHIRLPMWLRRLVTRGLAVIPVIICTIMYNGSQAALDTLLVNSQVFLSLALPFAMFPLIALTASKRVMGREFANPYWVTILGLVSGVVLTILNAQLIWGVLTGSG